MEEGDILKVKLKDETELSYKKADLSVDEIKELEGLSEYIGKLTKVNYGDQYIKGKNGRKELKANIEHTTPGGHTYKTDSLGRIDSAEGTLTKNTSKRNVYNQKVEEREDRLTTDDGGHLIANIFEGSGDLDNLVPMDVTLNRGDWKYMENTWARALSENPPLEVQVKIETIYSGSSKRPISFEVQYKIGDGKWRLHEFEN
ncbi:DNA/RNA non-specific endonuclease [Cellulosilyticum lentocellum]|uniref:Type VII secretion system protein EssD-like domain-containing protein n=1 Tax=Cellulosilyticum lentocellum (strain ATCC 49066 / DSM 5427 / NCIMB 11756 / RHM5) TaxID=642492 RepID=F2JHQ2_CELLD|nr:DNA/RNA non-specific endonuclease [Cellulosilyticum lentocellum]ADZ85394.1 hypothetical protein Clole_3712 [Cellulosilyticum lentocellum DSM 5427]